MSEGAGDLAWQTASALMSLQVNMNKRKGDSPLDMDHFNPYAEQRRKDRKRLTPAKLLSLKTQLGVQDGE